MKRLVRIDRFPHIAGEYRMYSDGTYRFVGDGQQPNGWRQEYEGTWTPRPEDLHSGLGCIG